METKKIFITLSIISFIVSAFFTVRLWQSGQTDEISRVIITIMAIILEASKLSFAKIAFDATEIKPLARLIISLTAIALFVVSMCASLAFLTNSESTIKAEEIKNSDEYKALQTKIEVQRILVDNKQKELDAIKSEIDKLPNNYYTIRQRKTELLSKKQAEYTDLVNYLEYMLQEKPSSTVTKKGTNAFFEKLTDIINKANNTKMNSDDLQFYFFAMLAILFDVVAVLLYYVSTQNIKFAEFANTSTSNTPKIENVTKKKNTPQISFLNQIKNKVKDITKSLQPKQQIEKKGNNVINLPATIPTPQKPKNDIGFKFENNEIHNTTNEIKDKYINTILNSEEYKKHKVSPGVQKMSKMLGITLETTRGIKKDLEMQGLLKVEGKQTKVLI